MDEETQLQTTGPLEVATSEPNPTVSAAGSQPTASQNPPTVAPASTAGTSTQTAVDTLKHDGERGFRSLVKRALAWLEVEASHLGKDITSEVQAIAAKLGL